jgi:hypothetical protein
VRYASCENLHPLLVLLHMFIYFLDGRQRQTIQLFEYSMYIYIYIYIYANGRGRTDPIGDLSPEFKKHIDLVHYASCDLRKL